MATAVFPSSLFLRKVFARVISVSLVLALMLAQLVIVSPMHERNDFSTLASSHIVNAEMPQKMMVCCEMNVVPFCSFLSPFSRYAESCVVASATQFFMYHTVFNTSLFLEVPKPPPKH